MRNYEDTPRYPWVLWLLIFLAIFVIPPIFVLLGMNGYSLR